MAESGVRNGEDAQRLADAGYGAVLVGETLIKAADRGAGPRRLAGTRWRRGERRARRQDLRHHVGGRCVAGGPSGPRGGAHVRPLPSAGPGPAPGRHRQAAPTEIVRPSGCSGTRRHRAWWRRCKSRPGPPQLHGHETAEETRWVRPHPLVIKAFPAGSTHQPLRRVRGRLPVGRRRQPRSVRSSTGGWPKGGGSEPSDRGGRTPGRQRGRCRRPPASVLGRCVRGSSQPRDGRTR